MRSVVSVSNAASVPRFAAAETPPTKRKRSWWGRKHVVASLGAGAMVATQEEQRRKMPSWLVSFIFHLALILILALVPLSEITRGPLTLFLGEAGGEGVTEFELSGLDASQATELAELDSSQFDSLADAGELLNIDLPELTELKRPPSEPIGTEAPAEILKNVPFGITKGLTGRSGALKSALLSKFGGSAETEEAVELGLQWLAKQQKSNGAWSLTGPYSLGGSSENTTAATAMALNAFLGAGYTHKEGKYQENVKLGLAYLVRRQDADGFFSEREPSRQQMYAQAIASITVIEAFGMSGDSDLRIASERAIAFAEWSQSNLNGWRYEPREDADLSVTGWFVMVLVTGKMAGLSVTESKLQNVEKFLDSVSYEEGSRYSYSEIEPASLSMTAEGLLCRLYLGWLRSRPALLMAIRDDLLPSVPREDDPEFSVYYWYYATQVLHHVGGKPWQTWNAAMKRVLPALQERAGREAGSWDPSRDVFGAAGGRLYTTCLNLYCLEVYYRHLSLYEIK